MPYKRARKPRARRARRARRAPLKKKIDMRGRAQYATVQETYDDNTSVLSNVGLFNQISLINFPRAYALSKYYEFFRIEEVVYTYRPLWNTYQEPPNSTTFASQKPNMYLQMDRANTLAGVTQNSILQAGIRGRPFDRQVIFKYKPNTLSMTTGAIPAAPTSDLLQGSQIEFNRWLPCTDYRLAVPTVDIQNTLSAATLPYFGHWAYVEQLGGNLIPMYTYTVSVRVTFKNPMMKPVTFTGDELAPRPLTITVSKPTIVPRTVIGLEETSDFHHVQQ